MSSAIKRKKKQKLLKERRKVTLKVFSRLGGNPQLLDKQLNIREAQRERRG